jgi:hypothetical protein
VRRLIQIALVALGIRAFLRWRKRRREEQAATPPVEPDPANELRRKLAESREEEADAVPEPAAAAVADRRAAVHGQGRAALDQMKSSDEG